jgi:outer membrane protein assembly factor BamD (BamD/ComL family)
MDYAGDLQRRVLNTVSGRGHSTASRWIPIAIAATLLFFVLNPSIFFNNTSSDISQLAHLDDVKIQYGVRGNSQVLLQQGIEALNEKSFVEAVNHFENSINQNPNDLNKGYTHYLCGLALLLKADRNTSAQTEQEKKALINNSLTHLQISLSTNNNLSMRENTLWYMAKAYLMKNDIEEARNYFQKITALKGRRFSKSREILSILEKY